MRTTKLLLAGVVVLIAGGLTTLSLTQGQDGAPTPPTPKVPTPPARPGRDISKWPFFPTKIYLSGKSGCEWLYRANSRDGRFLYGYLPALQAPMEGDSYVRQAGAAAALARAATYFNNDQAAARARQAVLTLLDDTGPEDPKDLTVRVSTLPSAMVNRLAAAAALVQAINDLPAAAADLLDPSDQLCNYLRRAQRGDGSLACTNSGPDGKPAADDNDTVNLCSGEALHALMRSQQHRPAAWKLDAVRKALAFYQARWRAAKNLVMVPGHTAAYAEAFHQTKERPFADFVFEMNDWLCTFQYHELDPQHPLWTGGFMGCADSKPMPLPPHVGSAAHAESLIEAARLARAVGDVNRWDRYKDAVERSLQFLTTLQYTDANSQHFADWYRPVVVGAFHASHTDGNLRIDYTQQAVSAMVAYLTHLAEVK